MVRKAEARLGSRHAAERVERCWGGSTNKHVDEVKDKIKKLLLEYVDSGDKTEATRCIKGLSMPFFHHEVVKQVRGRRGSGLDMVLFVLLSRWGSEFVTLVVENCRAGARLKCTWGSLWNDYGL